MKFAAPAGSRDGVRERQRRDRSTAPLLRARYPELTSVQIDFDFTDRSEFPPSSLMNMFHPPARAFFRFVCPYSDCNGEVDLTREVELAVNAEDTQASGQAPCTGHRRGGSACRLQIKYSISVHR